MNAAAECKDLQSTADFLGFAPQHLYYLVEAPENFYVSIEIPKRSDPTQFRTLEIPRTELKGVQKAIYRKILSEHVFDDCVHSYVSSRSIITAAREFCSGKAVLKLDIENFFPTISFKRVLGLFKSFGFTPAAAYILARLTTVNDRIAQGAPTSPVISNLIVRGMDVGMKALARTWEMKYLRYSDDIFFYKHKNFNHPKLTTFAQKIITDAGFTANGDKTKYYAKGVPRTTLGLLTHGDSPKIPGRQRRIYRSLFFKASRNVHWADQNKDRLRGIAEWYKCVYGKDDTYLQYRQVLQNVALIRIHDSYQSN
ncbi:reverse transcriptase domain-containing protein (plasmid) [Thioclava litoralis]|uniref:RNA-directed DNA polymerase n=1 Tax=Thioclava litoralis TaxID=3076557 RepID=A0ABZ1E4M1_9RHOB|nr:reverse transcriptase domain-containing protein [Thioclava sp. FTW29]